MQTPVRVKICGITNVQQAQAVTACGADAIGLVFFSKSPRNISIEQARDIAMAVGPFVTVVGLFVNETTAVINTVLETVPLQLLQFHGDEDAAFCEQFNRPYMKALRINAANSVEQSQQYLLQAAQSFDSSNGLLIDSYNPNVAGGTGEQFNWDIFPVTGLEKPIILAGGLTPNNAGAAIQQVKPYALDVSSGVESAPGVKDIEKVSAFIQAAKNSG